MSQQPERAPVRGNPLNWVLIVMGIIAAGFIWWAMGQPGIAQSDGAYTCRDEYLESRGLGPAVWVNPTVRVEGGEIVSVTTFDPQTSTSTEVAATGYKRVDPGTLEITADNSEYTCKVED